MRALEAVIGSIVIANIIVTFSSYFLSAITDRHPWARHHRQSYTHDVLHPFFFKIYIYSLPSFLLFMVIDGIYYLVK
jgi:hypothetical protein